MMYHSKIYEPLPSYELETLKQYRGWFKHIEDSSSYHEESLSEICTLIRKELYELPFGPIYWSNLYDMLTACALEVADVLSELIKFEIEDLGDVLSREGIL